MGRLSRFFPSLFGFGDRLISIFGHPHFLARSAIRSQIASFALSLKGDMLDVGCGTMPYRVLFRDVSTYRGLEIDQARNLSNPLVTDFYDGSIFPYANSSFDVVLCSQVLEHSFSPDQLLNEVFRVLRPGGVLLLTIPFLWPEHEQPFDSQRFTSFGLRHRLDGSGFQVTRMVKTNPGFSAIVQLLIESIESGARLSIGRFPSPRFRALLSLSWRFFFLPFVTCLNILGLIMRSLYSCDADSAASDFYLDLAVLAQRPPAS